jgi:hypothetical protein
MSEGIVQAAEIVVLRDEIYAQLDQINQAEHGLEHGYARLGNLLVQFKKVEGWRPLGYHSFEKFMSELKERYSRGRTQLYNYVTVAEKLLPIMSAEALDEMGISKAIELKRVVSNGQVLTADVIEIARKSETTIKELRAMLQGAYALPETERPGNWFDFGGTYLTADEKKEFVDACKVAATVLNLSKAAPEWAQRKEIILTFAREFLGTHAAEVYGPGKVLTVNQARDEYNGNLEQA